MLYTKINYFTHLLLVSKYRMFINVSIIIIIYALLYGNKLVLCMNDNTNFIQDEVQPFLNQSQIIENQQQIMESQKKLLQAHVNGITRAETNYEDLSYRYSNLHDSYDKACSGRAEANEKIRSLELQNQELKAKIKILKKKLYSK